MTEGPEDESPLDLVRREFESAPRSDEMITAYQHLFSCEQRREDLRNQLILADHDLNEARRAVDDPELLLTVKPSPPRTADMVAEERWRAARVQARARRAAERFYEKPPAQRRTWGRLFVFCRELIKNIWKAGSI